MSSRPSDRPLPATPIFPPTDQFSKEFCMAIMVLEKRAGQAKLNDAVRNRSDKQAMFQ